MRPALPLLVIAILAVPLAGCVGATEDALDAAEAALAGDGVAGPIQRYTGNGIPLPPPTVDEAGQASYLLTGHGGAEPNIGITSSGAIFATAGDTVIRSTDDGATWEVVYGFGLEGYGAPVDPVRNSDPMLWVDPDTDRVYNMPMFPTLACSSVIWSDDDGATWTERHMMCPTPVMDHQKIGGGPPSADAPPGSGALYQSVLYFCYNALLSTNCIMSYDGGITWPIEHVVMDEARHDCGGLNGMPSVGPTGFAAVGVSQGCDTLKLAYTTDSGLSWRVAKVPGGLGGVANDPEIAFTPDGTMYVMWAGDDHLTYVARVHPDDLLGCNGDCGVNDHEVWGGPWQVSPPDVGSTVFWALSAGADGQVAMGFLGTTDWSGDPSDAEDPTRWHMFLVTSDDADANTPTFTAHQVTPDEDPVQIGCIWMRGFPGAPCRNMLDFIDSAVSPDGTFHVIYTEGCAEGCADNPDATADDSRARDVAMARLEGWVLGP